MKLKPYQKYKDSGIQWIGKIPDSWENFRLKHVVNEFISGGTPSSDNDKFWAQEDEEGINWVAIADMTNHEFIEETHKKITTEGLADKGLRILPKGTLIYSIFASLGKVSILNIDATTNQAILGLIPSKKMHNKFLKYYLISLEETIIALSNANTQNNLNSTIVKNIDLALPLNIEEQTSVSNFIENKLFQLNQTIEKDKQLIDLLKEKRTALINHVVTKGLNPKAKMKDSGIEWIGEVPEGWEVKRLKFLVSKINSGVTPSGGAKVYTDEGIPLIRSQNVHFDGLRLDDVAYIPPEIHNTMLNAIVKRHDVLINITGASIGRCTYVEDQFEKANVNQHVCIIRPKNIHYKYLAYYLMSQIGQDQVFSVQMGTSREGLNFQQLGDFILFYPSIDEQKKVVDYIESNANKIYQTIQKIEEKIELLEEYKKSLIHHVVTGKVDVRDAIA